MAIHRNRNLAITLLFSLVILLALAPSSSAVSPDVPQRRDHVNLNRMIKRRAPHALLPRQGHALPQVGAVGAAADPSTGGASSPVPSSTPPASAASPTQAPATSQSPQSISSPVAAVLSSAIPSVSSTPSQSSASPTSSTTPTSTTSSPTPSNSPRPSTSNIPTPSSQANKQLPSANGQPSVDSVTLTSHAPAASSSGSDNSQIGGSSLSHSAIIILIIIAASIGGCVVIWTIIRKWKFRPSAQFEDRLEPVDWQPAEHDSGLPIRRAPSNASSFHSGGHDNVMGLSRSDSGAGPNAARNLTPIPDHDFTAGPAAPVGGYADLARGPSPQPLMQEALQRGPSINHGYETYYGGNGAQEVLQRGPSINHGYEAYHGGNGAQEALQRGPSINHGYEAYHGGNGAQEALQRGPSVNHGYEAYHGGHGAQEAYDYNSAGAGY